MDFLRATISVSILNPFWFQFSDFDFSFVLVGYVCYLIKRDNPFKEAKRGLRAQIIILQIISEIYFRLVLFTYNRSYEYVQQPLSKSLKKLIPPSTATRYID